MGSCFSRGGGGAAASSSSSSFADNQQKPNCTANVVSVDGDLRQYSIPVTASQVLESGTASAYATANSSSSASAFFLCDSDCLYFDDYIPALAPEDQLQPAHIYFVLPLPKLHYKLTPSDMAALAVKASLALQTHNNNINPGSSRKAAQISPVRLLEQEEEDQPRPRSGPPLPVQQPRPSSNLKVVNTSTKQKHKQQSSVSAGSLRKLHRLSSRRAKMAVRSYRINLTTISEGSVLLFN